VVNISAYRIGKFQCCRKTSHSGTSINNYHYCSTHCLTASGIMFKTVLQKLLWQQPTIEELQLVRRCGIVCGTACVTAVGWNTFR